MGVFSNSPLKDRALLCKLFVGVPVLAQGMQFLLCGVFHAFSREISAFRRLPFKGETGEGFFLMTPLSLAKFKHKLYWHTDFEQRQDNS